MDEQNYLRIFKYLINFVYYSNDGQEKNHIIGSLKELAYQQKDYFNVLRILIKQNNLKEIEELISNP